MRTLFNLRCAVWRLLPVGPVQVELPEADAPGKAVERVTVLIAAQCNRTIGARCRREARSGAVPRQLAFAIRLRASHSPPV
jgi:hypothetical protein